MKKLYLLFAFLFALIGYQDAGAWMVYCWTNQGGSQAIGVNAWTPGNGSSKQSMKKIGTSGNNQLYVYSAADWSYSKVNFYNSSDTYSAESDYVNGCAYQFWAANTSTTNTPKVYLNRNGSDTELTLSGTKYTKTGVSLSGNAITKIKISVGDDTFYMGSDDYYKNPTSAVSLAAGDGNNPWLEFDNANYDITFDPYAMTVSFTNGTGGNDVADITSAAVIGFVDGATSWDSTGKSMSPSNGVWSWTGKITAGNNYFRVKVNGTEYGNGTSSDAVTLTAGTNAWTDMAEQNNNYCFSVPDTSKEYTFSVRKKSDGSCYQIRITESGDVTVTGITLKCDQASPANNAVFVINDKDEWILSETSAWTGESNKYYLEVTTSKPETVTYLPTGISDNKYYVNAGSEVSISKNSSNHRFVFVTGYPSGKISGKVIIGSNGLPEKMTFYNANGVNDQPVVRPDAPGTVKWSVTGASDANPRYFLVGDRLNNNRVTPEAELIKQDDGTYVLSQFVMVPDGTFKIRKFTGVNTFTNLSAQSGNFWVNTDQLSGNASENTRKFTHALISDNGTMEWKLGYTMVNMRLDANGSNITIELDYSHPSTLKEAPIHGLPYVALVGDAQGQVDQLGTPNTYGTSDLTGTNSGTNGGWQEGWVQYTADGKIYTYDSGLNSSAYGNGCNEGNAMYSTLVPPRTPISFCGVKNADGFESGSPKNTFTYVKTDQRKNSMTTNTDALDDDKWYAVYELNNVRMKGAYKLWTGWGGNTLGDPKRANWNDNPNFGFGEWSSSQSHPIEVETWYNMNGSQNLPANGDTKGTNVSDDEIGGNYNFDEERYFAKIRFWYKLSDSNDPNAYDGKVATKGSWMIHLLAHGAPYAKIDRAGKTSLSCEYSVQNPESDSRTVSSWGVDLYKDGKLYRKNVATSDETDPKKIGGTVVVDDLPSGLYYFVMHMRYDENSAGDVVIVQPEDAVTATRRIYGMIQPVITRAEQVTESKFGNTLYSFDIAVEAHAPSTTTDNGSELSDLIKSYKVTFPSITGYDFAASIEAKNSDGTEATTSVSGNTVTVTPDNGNNNAMPSLTFKNVIPGDHKFTVEMLAEDGDTEWPADNVTSASETVEMVVPSMKLDNMRASLNQVAADADMTHIALEERMNVRHGHVREHDTEGSSWENEGKTGYQNNGGYGAHLSRYNRIDAYGDLSTLLVTDGVLTDWDVNIEVVLQDAGAGLDEKYHYTPDASSTINKTANELVISYLPVAMQDKPIADELTIYTDNATAKAQTYHAPAKTIVNYVVTTTYKRKTVTSDVVTATKDESRFTVYNPEKPNDSNVQFGAVTGSFDKPHGIQLEGHSWQKWYNAFNVLDLETGNANGNFAVGFFFTNGTELPVYEPTDPQHKIYPGGHVLDCSINRHNGYTERFYNVFTDAPSATKHFGEMAVDATGYGVDEYGGGGYKSLPLHLGCVYKFDKVTDKPLSQDKLSSFATLEGVLITTHPIVVKPDGNGVRPTVSLMTSDSKTIPFVAAAKNAKAASRALLAIETPSHVEKGFDGATTDLDEVLGDFNTAFRVFPNPAVDIVTVEASAEIGNVEVVASNGATALKAEIRDTNGQLDVSALPAGLYLLRTDAGTTRLIVK